MKPFHSARSPALSHKGRGSILFCLTQTPGAYRSEHKRGRESAPLIFSERGRQRAEISPRSARQCAKRHVSRAQIRDSSSLSLLRMTECLLLVPLFSKEGEGRLAQGL